MQKARKDFKKLLKKKKHTLWKGIVPKSHESIEQNWQNPRVVPLEIKGPIYTALHINLSASFHPKVDSDWKSVDVLD